MKARIISLFQIIVFLIGCSSDAHEQYGINDNVKNELNNGTEQNLSADYDSLDAYDYVELTVHDITSTGCDLSILNKTDAEIVDGERYELNVYENNTWYKLNSAPDAIGEDPYLSFNAVGIGIENDSNIIIEYTWENYYGELSAGIYRIVIPIWITIEKSECLFSCEFEIK